MAEAQSNTPRRGAAVATGIAAPSRYHEKFAATVLKQIEAGTAPWQREAKAGEPVLPRNAITGRRYTGGNALYLASRAQDRGFTDNRWISKKQLRENDGKLVRGAVGERILYRDDAGEKPVWRTATVYNVEQTRGLKLDRPPQRAEWHAHRAADIVIAGSAVPIKESPGDLGYYVKDEDRIVIPERSRFSSADTYYNTAFRHMGHASGHEDRMNRDTFKQAHSEGLEGEAHGREHLRVELATMTTDAARRGRLSTHRLRSLQGPVGQGVEGRPPRDASGGCRGRPDLEDPAPASARPAPRPGAGGPAPQRPGRSRARPGHASAAGAGTRRPEHDPRAVTASP